MKNVLSVPVLCRAMKELNDLELSLRLLETSDILKNADAEGIRQMIKEKEKKKKEQLVLSTHRKKMESPTLSHK